MSTTNIFQPENLSAAEWELLQLLTTYTGSFSVEAILTNQYDKIPAENEILNFYRHFYRLKNCSYIEVIPAVSNEDDSGGSIYQLSATGIKATSPKENYVYQKKSLASRKVRNPNSFYLK